MDYRCKWAQYSSRMKDKSEFMNILQLAEGTQIKEGKEKPTSIKTEKAGNGLYPALTAVSDAETVSTWIQQKPV